MKWTRELPQRKPGGPSIRVVDDEKLVCIRESILFWPEIKCKFCLNAEPFPPINVAPVPVTTAPKSS